MRGGKSAFMAKRLLWKMAWELANDRPFSATWLFARGKGTQQEDLLDAVADEMGLGIPWRDHITVKHVGKMRQAPAVIEPFSADPEFPETYTGPRVDFPAALDRLRRDPVEFVKAHFKVADESD